MVPLPRWAGWPGSTHVKDQHGPPDGVGMVEIGYSSDPAYRRRRYATAMVAELLRWAAAEPSAVTVRANISPENDRPLATIG